MQMSYSYASDLPFKNFCKLAKQAETIKNRFWLWLSIVWETCKLTLYQWWNRELLKCKLKCYEKPMKDPLGVSPSKGNQGTTRGKEKILLTSVGIKPTTSGLDLPLLIRRSWVWFPTIGVKNPQENLAILNIWCRNVTTSTRETTTRVWIYDVRMAQFVLNIEKLTHIISPGGSHAGLPVSVPDYGSCSHKRLVQFWELSKSLVPINHELYSRSCDFLY